MSAQVWKEYRHELETWLNNGWLLPYPAGELGPQWSLFPLMAVLNKISQKYAQCYPFLNWMDTSSPTQHMPTSAQKLRKVRKKGSNMSVLKLRTPYLQVRVHKSMWSYQTIIFERKRYCHLRMGFRLSVAPSIMQGIVKATLSKDDKVWQATLAYIDNVFINEDIASATRATAEQCTRAWLYSSGRG